MKAITKKNKYGIFGDCLRGDVRQSIKLAKGRKSSLSITERKQLFHLEKRFSSAEREGRIAIEDPLAKAIVRIYRRYYHRVLMKSLEHQTAEAELFAELKVILKEYKIKSEKVANLDRLEPFLKKILLKRGYYSLIARIEPYRSLSLWTVQKATRLEVKLPETKIRVKVNYVDGLIEHGWMYFATLGKFYAGGWVPDDARDEIFCVVKAYRKKPEAMRVNLLAHEAQHVVDLRAYPKLSGADLEYRAKLTELSLLSRPGRLLSKFRFQAVEDRQLPHSYAAWHIAGKLQENSGLAINEKAKELLNAHTELLKKSGPNVKSVL